MKTLKMMHPVFRMETEYVPPWELRREFAPQVLPPYWSEMVVPELSEDGLVFVFNPPFGRRFKVLLSASREADGRLWAHVSLSKWNPSGVAAEEPTWTDIRKIKDLFVGRDRKAVIVLPPDGEYVNLGEVHHLWVCLDGDPLPDFTRGTGSI